MVLEPYEWPKNRRVIDCVFWICFQMLSASISSIPQGAGAGIDVARLYIALAFGLLILNCLRGGIGGGILPPLQSTD
jgi:hypothetical protein